MEYNVLWIDDQWELQKAFIGTAEQIGINIFPFESHEEGIDDLKVRTEFYHAVILDAKVKNKKEDTTTNLVGLRASRDFLIELNKDIYLPYFIFTGQPDYAKNEMFEESYGKYYIKGSDNDKLYSDIIQACEKQPEIQARKEFPETFKVFDIGILDNHSKLLFLEIVKNLQNNDYRKKNMTVQRDLFESILCGLNNPIPCIPNDFLNNGKPNMEWCTLFLENRNIKDFTHKLNKITPKDIKASFRKLKESTNQYSHISDEVIPKYPYVANSYLLMEILIWIPAFVEEHYNNYI